MALSTTSTEMTISQLPYGKALYAYEGKEPGDLKFNKGDIIILRRKVDENWYHGELNGNHGFFPASYIQCIKPLPQAPPQGKALYDFEIKDKDQDKDCLTFTKDEILTVIRRVDDNWAEGMLGDKIGIFPILYVELNESAKQLIEMDKTCLAAASGSAGAGTAGAAQRQAEGKKNAKKRHSFTALSMTHKSSQAASNRHSMEISAPVLISSSDPRAAARIGDLTHLSSSAPAQVSSQQEGEGEDMASTQSSTCAKVYWDISKAAQALDMSEGPKLVK
ncbi:PREDICTED: SH3 domain-containing RING finger protein 3-like [Chaetura pelagica]|uniref:SH3 domain-containing RING finger protein 3-like n=1 Tax=Chaetura pelagica TaxID=8897 RepID=UPI000523E59B|nr:PREDICTED: SH3 domain-containing RING finger protein 3-like [Chaetura pelagica]